MDTTLAYLYCGGYPPGGVGIVVAHSPPAGVGVRLQSAERSPERRVKKKKNTLIILEIVIISWNQTRF